MLHKIRGLRGASGRVRVSEVITTADKTSIGRTSVLRTEIGIRVCGSLSCFDVGKRDALGLPGIPVNGTLMTGNVDA